MYILKRQGELMNSIPIETANKMLSLVSPITEQMMSAWREAVISRERLKELLSSDNENPKLFAETAKSFSKATQTINKNLDELESLGCIVESYEQGIIDFPSEMDGEEIMLCWEFGEAEIQHHHKRGEDYTHRLLINQVLEK